MPGSNYSLPRPVQKSAQKKASRLRRWLVQLWSRDLDAAERGECRRGASVCSSSARPSKCAQSECRSGHNLSSATGWRPPASATPGAALKLLKRQVSCFIFKFLLSAPAFNLCLTSFGSVRGRSLDQIVDLRMFVLFRVLHTICEASRGMCSLHVCSDVLDQSASQVRVFACPYPDGFYDHEPCPATLQRKPNTCAQLRGGKPA